MNTQFIIMNKAQLYGVKIDFNLSDFSTNSTWKKSSTTFKVVYNLISDTQTQKRFDRFKIDLRKIPRTQLMIQQVANMSANLGVLFNGEKTQSVQIYWRHRTNKSQASSTDFNNGRCWRIKQPWKVSEKTFQQVCAGHNSRQAFIYLSRFHQHQNNLKFKRRCTTSLRNHSCGTRKP